MVIMMIIEKTTMSAICFNALRANGDHQSVRAEVEEVRIGAMKEVTNAGKRRKLILKTSIMAPLPGSKMVLKTTRGTLVGKMNLLREQDSSLGGEVVEVMVIMNLLPLQLEPIGTQRVCWELTALDLLLNLPSIRQVEITSSTWLATLLTP